MNPRTRFVVQQARDAEQQRIVNLEAELRALEMKKDNVLRDLREAKYQKYALEESLRSGA